MSRPTFRLDFLATTTGPDGPDQDRAPDTEPLGDVTITCTPSITHIIYPPSAPGEPHETSFIKVFKATTGADGRLKGPDGLSGIELPAADPTAAPTGFSWKIETRWGGGTATITKTFPAPPGGTVVDFSTVITQPANPSTELAAWTAAVTTTTAARDETLPATRRSPTPPAPSRPRLLLLRLRPRLRRRPRRPLVPRPRLRRRPPQPPRRHRLLSPHAMRLWPRLRLWARAAPMCPRR